MDRAIDVYCGQLGMRLLRRKPGVAYPEVTMVEDPLSENRIELLLDKACLESHLDHIAFEVDNLDEVLELLQRSGFGVEREPFDVPGTTIRTSFLRSPDGVKVELLHYGVEQDMHKG
jgi:catechol 2,3-dioxygenase-like lactoylglutathione lyase family enzyme